MQLILCSSGLTRTTLTPDQVSPEEPSIKMLYMGGLVGSISSFIPGIGVNSTTEFAKACSLTAILVLKTILNLLNFMAHFNNLPEALGYCSTCLCGKLVNTYMVYARKYGFNFEKPLWESASLT